MVKMLCNFICLRYFRCLLYTSPWLFRIMARLNRLDKHLKAGEYQFSPMISMQAALDKMARGEIFYRRITLAEGLTTREMINLLNAEPMLSGEVTLAVKEGELLSLIHILYCPILCPQT